MDDSQGMLADGSGQITDLYFTKKYDWGPSPYDITDNFRASVMYSLPHWEADNFAAKLTNGWWVTSIISAQSGPVFTPSLNFSNSLSGLRDRASYVTSDNLTTALSFNPNAVVYDPNTVILGGTDHWFNYNMFTVGPAGYHGDVGRNSLRGPAFQNWDFSLNKNTAIKQLGESGTLQFRMEVFNILNHPNWGPPSSTVASSRGMVGTAGRISSPMSQTNARLIQFALKLIF